MKSDLEKMILGHRPVLVEFYTEACKPCKVLDPAMGEVKLKAGSRAKVIKIDLGKNSQYAEQYNIYNVPHLIIFVDGKIFWRHGGVLGAAELLEHLEMAIRSSAVEENSVTILREEAEL